MRPTNFHAGIVVAATVFAGHAWADDVPPAEGDTMMVIDEGTSPEDIVSVIELPDSAADAARGHAAEGMATANAARAGGRSFGHERADSARDSAGRIADDARANASEVADEARQNAAALAHEARENAADVAGEARENAAEIAESMREAAQGMRDDARDQHRPEPPEPAGRF